MHNLVCNHLSKLFLGQGLESSEICFFLGDCQQKKFCIIKNLSLSKKRSLAFALGFWEVISKPLGCHAWWECLCFSWGIGSLNSLRVEANHIRKTNKWDWEWRLWVIGIIGPSEGEYSEISHFGSPVSHVYLMEPWKQLWTLGIEVSLVSSMLFIVTYWCWESNMSDSMERGQLKPCIWYLWYPVCFTLLILICILFL